MDTTSDWFYTSIQQKRTLGMLASAFEITKSLEDLGLGSWESIEKEINERNDAYLKKKLNDALKKKHQEIQKLSEVEEYEKRCGKKKSGTEEKCCSQPARKMSMSSHHKRNKKSFEEEWDVHRAYQLLLAEHHKRVKTSDMNKDTA